MDTQLEKRLLIFFRPLRGGSPPSLLDSGSGLCDLGGCSYPQACASLVPFWWHCGAAALTGVQTTGSEGRAPALAHAQAPSPPSRETQAQLCPRGAGGGHPAQSRRPHPPAHLLIPHTPAGPAPRAEHEPRIHQAATFPAPQEPAVSEGYWGCILNP